MTLRRCVVLVALVLMVVGAVALRVVWEGRRELAAGDAAHARGDEREARRHWQRAASWELPGAAHVAAAQARFGGERIAMPRAPGSAAWLVVAVVGLAIWLGGVVAFSRRGLVTTRHGVEVLRRTPAVVAGIFVAAGLVAWMVGLYKA